MSAKFLLIILFIIISAVPANSQDASKLLYEVKNKLELVNDYEVEIDVQVDMEFLRIPKVSANPSASGVLIIINSLFIKS